MVKGNDTLSQQFGTITRIPSVFIFDRQGRRAVAFTNEQGGPQATLDTAALQRLLAPLL